MPPNYVDVDDDYEIDDVNDDDDDVGDGDELRWLYIIMLGLIREAGWEAFYDDSIVVYVMAGWVISS